MTIEAIVPRSRLYSCLSTDEKPIGWAPGLLMLEMDTGVWWYTDEAREWQPCHPTHTAFDALLTRAADLETRVSTQAAEIVTMKAEIVTLRTGRPK